jgi:hypothetical protein
MFVYVIKYIVREDIAWSQDSAVSIMTKLQVGRVQILAGSRDSSLLQDIQAGSGLHPAFLFNDYQGLFP